MQKRVENIESIQDDVIDSLAEIRKFLCSDSRTFSGALEGSILNASANHIPPLAISKSGSFSRSRSIYSSFGLKKLKSPKECDTSKISTSDNISELPEKQFDCKKDLGLDSDKQDSGLDSDCREIHDNLSLKASVNWVKPESGDELLHLLDEISQRTEVLQKQLSVIDQKGCSDNVESNYPTLPATNHEKTLSLAQEESLKASASCINCTKQSLEPAAGAFGERSMSRRNPAAESSECFDGAAFSEHVQKIQRRTSNKIDSAMVSSILKETSVVDLQRQVLIYLVENAVLHTKLGELEHLLSSKTNESSKIENSLKDETRLLMMENRELRISLDEQKLETNALRSKVSMLERVLNSVSAENRELTWQLGESLGIQNLSQKEPRKFSSSFTYGNNNNPKLNKRSSLPAQFVNKKETNVSCVKSKLLSNASSFLDVTVEEPEQQWGEVQSSPVACENPGVPMQSSTPFTKLRDVKSVTTSPSSPSNFQSVKKRFKSTEKDNIPFKNHNVDKHLEEGSRDAYPDSCTKNLKFCNSNYDDSSKFPFTTIIEKLKANSDYRLSRRTSLTQTNEVNFSSDHVKPAPFSRGKPTTSEGEESAVSTENLRQSSSPSKNFQARKGKNIHQRIQDILDRIMSESEEAT